MPPACRLGNGAHPWHLPLSLGRCSKGATCCLEAAGSESSSGARVSPVQPIIFSSACPSLCSAQSLRPHCLTANENVVHGFAPGLLSVCSSSLQMTLAGAPLHHSIMRCRVISTHPSLFQALHVGVLSRLLRAVAPVLILKRGQPMPLRMAQVWLAELQKVQAKPSSSTHELSPISGARLRKWGAAWMVFWMSVRAENAWPWLAALAVMKLHMQQNAVAAASAVVGIDEDVGWKRRSSWWLPAATTANQQQ